MTPLTHLSVIEANGADARDFLHAQLSADVAALENGDSLFACFCNPQGRVLDLLMVAGHETGFLLLATNSRVDALLTRLRMFVMRLDVKLALREDLLAYGVMKGDETFEHMTVTQPQAGLVYAIGSKDSSAKDDGDAWRAGEFEAGVLWLDTQTSGQFLPQWLGFDQSGAINFRKGCYPGQEVIARMHYLGKVKRLPILVWLDGVIEPAAMEGVQLHSGGSEMSATLAGVTATAGGTLCYLVVRDREALQPTELSYNGQTLKIQRWATI
jgi:folate-binding protein YgfZ